MKCVRLVFGTSSRFSGCVKITKGLFSYQTSCSIVVEVHQRLYICPSFPRVHKIGSKHGTVKSVVAASTPAPALTLSFDGFVAFACSKFTRAARCCNCLCHAGRYNSVRERCLSETCKLIEEVCDII